MMSMMKGVTIHLTVHQDSRLLLADVPGSKLISEQEKETFGTKTVLDQVTAQTLVTGSDGAEKLDEAENKLLM